MFTDKKSSLTELQRSMIRALGQHRGNVVIASVKAGVSLQSHRSWIKTNRRYMRACQRKLNQAQRDLNAILSARICESIQSGDKESIAATKFVYSQDVINRVMAGEIYEFNYINTNLTS